MDRPERGPVPPRNPGLVDPQVDARIGAVTRGARLGPVAAALRQHCDAILRRWLAAARAQPFHAARPGRVVADHIPHLLDALIGFLEHYAPRAVDGATPMDDPGVHDAAGAHARDRFAQGLSPAEVMTEFRLLRQEIGRALREETEGAGAGLAAELLVHDALDGAASLALAALEAHEAERQRLRAELAAIVASSSDAIIGETLDGTITSWNPAAARLYGYAAAEAVGHRISLIIPPERVDELGAILERVGRGERIVPYETIQVRKDGRRVDVSLTVSPIRDAAGVVVGASVIARDISEHKRLDQALRLHSALLQAAHEAVFAWDHDAGITVWNRSAKELYGYTADEALGRLSHALLGTPPEQVAPSWPPCDGTSGGTVSSVTRPATAASSLSRRAWCWSLRVGGSTC